MTTPNHPRLPPALTAPLHRNGAPFAAYGKSRDLPTLLTWADHLAETHDGAPGVQEVLRCVTAFTDPRASDDERREAVSGAAPFLCGQPPRGAWGVVLTGDTAVLTGQGRGLGAKVNVRLWHGVPDHVACRVADAELHRTDVTEGRSWYAAVVARWPWVTVALADMAPLSQPVQSVVDNRFWGRQYRWYTADGRRGTTALASPPYWAARDVLNLMDEQYMTAPAAVAALGDAVRRATGRLVSRPKTAEKYGVPEVLAAPDPQPDPAGDGDGNLFDDL